MITIIEAAHERLIKTVEAYIKPTQHFCASISVTDWGVSAYVTCYENESMKQVAKFRISDHSVENINRLFGEIHLDYTSVSYDYAVELALRPENFTEVIEYTPGKIVQSCEPIGVVSSYIPAHAVIVGQKVAKKSGNLVNIYQWQQMNVTRSIVRI